MEKKRILCFGDSNTYGYAPDGSRFGEGVRWTSVLSEKLGDDYRIIEAGFNGRTALFDDPTEGGYKSGIQYMPPCLMSANPLDLVIIMIGTNDTKMRYGLNAFTIAQGVGELVKCAKRYAQNAALMPPPILLVSPIHIGENLMATPMGAIFGEQAIAASKGFSKEFALIAKAQGALFIDGAEFASPCKEDAIHMTEKEHARLADGLFAKIKTIL